MSIAESVPFMSIAPADMDDRSVLLSPEIVPLALDCIVVSAVV